MRNCLKHFLKVAFLWVVGGAEFFVVSLLFANIGNRKFWVRWYGESSSVTTSLSFTSDSLLAWIPLRLSLFLRFFFFFFFIRFLILLHQVLLRPLWAAVEKL